MPYDLDLWAIVIASVVALSVVVVHFIMHPHRRLIMLAYTISMIMIFIGYLNQIVMVLPFEIARSVARFGVLSLVCNVWAQHLPEVHYDVWKRVYDFIYKRVHSWKQRP